VTSEAHAGHLYTPSGRSRISGCPHSQACRPTTRGSALICTSVTRSAPPRKAPQDGQRAESLPEGSSSCTSQKGQRRGCVPGVIRSCIFLTFPLEVLLLGQKYERGSGRTHRSGGQFLVRQVAYSRRSVGGPTARDLGEAAVVYTPQRGLAPLWWRRSCRSFHFPSLPERIEAPPGGLLPRPRRGA
jgi:hypothetical protein